ncbi:MAG: nodulation protein NodH [Planktomarina sp.]
MAEDFDYFIVLAEMRTGSNFLEENLNALPDVICHGEAFNPHFIGYPNIDNLFDITQEMREQNPQQLLDVIKAQNGKLEGFRFFHDHDTRAFDACMNDLRCAKVVLTRNPIDSFVSWKIASQTGQWKLTNPTRQRSAKIDFVAAEFEEHLQKLHAFQVKIQKHLQVTAQTAFYLAYEDLQDLDVLNGLARFLGSDHALPGLSKKLKKQNPMPLKDKVENFGDMEASLVKMDPFNLNQTPNFEPRRGPMVPSYVAAANAPLLYLPIKCGPDARVMQWLADIDGVDPDELQSGFSQKSLRQWKRQHKGHRSFTVVQHPVKRAFTAFMRHILPNTPEAYTEVRKTLKRVHGLNLPMEGPDDQFSRDDLYETFVGFLKFLKGNLSGQTALRVDPAWASQSHVIQGFADITVPDVIVRDELLEDGLAFLAAQTGTPYVSPREDENSEALMNIYDDVIEDLARETYQKDYLAFGFTPLSKM